MNPTASEHEAKDNDDWLDELFGESECTGTYCNHEKEEEG